MSQHDDPKTRMKRRSFLAMLGAGVAAPMLPGASLAAAPASYSRYTFGLAVFHARTRAHVSARGLAYVLKVTKPQAEAMIAEMTRKGMVTPVLGTGSVRAVSNILKPDAWGLDAAARRARAASRQARLQVQGPAQDLPDWLRYVRQLARAEGFPLQTARVAA